ncbi:MAG TPA: hypothetical protein VGD58_01665 [Herpetosiphonaceae bacterium]
MKTWTSKTPRWIGVLWLVVLALSLAQLADVAGASHRDQAWTRRHNWNIHTASDGYGAEDEDYCYESQIGEASSAWWGDKVRMALVTSPDGDPNKYWDGTGNYRIDLWKTSAPCNSYGDRSWIEMEYYLVYNGPYVSGCGGSTCVIHDQFVNQTNGNHAHAKVSRAWIRWYTISYGNDTEIRRAMNHESGHIFGLLDPGGCEASIMHNQYYGCPYSNWWPSSSDFASVRAAMDNQ